MTPGIRLGDAAKEAVEWYLKNWRPFLSCEQCGKQLDRDSAVVVVPLRAGKIVWYCVDCSSVEIENKARHDDSVALKAREDERNHTAVALRAQHCLQASDDDSACECCQRKFYLAQELSKP